MKWPAPATRASSSRVSIPKAPPQNTAFRPAMSSSMSVAKAVSNAGDVRKALSEAKSEGKHDVLMRVKTADTMQFVAMPIG